jgi:hypothetical protein
MDKKRKKKNLIIIVILCIGLKTSSFPKKLLQLLPRFAQTTIFFSVLFLLVLLHFIVIFHIEKV